MFIRKRYTLYLLIIAGCFLAFYFFNLFPVTFSREIPAVIETPAGETLLPPTPEKENHSHENTVKESTPEPASPAPSGSPTSDPLNPEGGDGLLQPDQSIIEQLSFLQSPIPGALVTSRDSQLPGAPRTYRNGTHQGLDYYDGACGVPIRLGDPVYAAGEGVIDRIDHQYTELTEQERNELLRICSEMEETPDDILDKLRGRQVWIKHPDGIITVYAHLNQVAELQKGDLIQAGDFIGNIGNSGTSDGAKGTTEEAHLHFEIWLGEHYLGEGLPPAEARKLLQEILE